MPRLGAGDAGRATGSATLGRRAGPPACYCSDVRSPPACTRADATGVPMSDGSLTIAARSYAAVMALAPAPLAARCAAMAARIPEAALAGPGREAMPHVTVRWGLDDAAAPAIRAALAGWPGPARARLGRTSAWPTPDGDCVKLDVLSPDLAELRQLIELACPEAATTFPFDPHLTLAYVESGRGAEFAGWDDLAGVIVEFTELVIGLTDDNQEVVPLGSRIVGASGFDPNQPRDEDGRWTDVSGPVPNGHIRLYRVESKDLGDQGAWLQKHLTPKQWETFASERGRLFADNLKDIENYGAGEPTHNTFVVDVPHDAARGAKREHSQTPGFFEYLLPKELVDKKRLAVLAPKAGVRGAAFDPNQPRDERGRWTDEDGAPFVQRSFPGGIPQNKMTQDVGYGRTEVAWQINSKLIAGVALADHEEEDVRSLEFLMARHPLAENTLVFHGGNQALIDALNKADETPTPAFLSTAFTARTAGRFQKHGGAVIAIEVPAGTHHALGSLAEEELVLPRGGSLTRRVALDDGTPVWRYREGKATKERLDKIAADWWRDYEVEYGEPDEGAAPRDLTAVSFVGAYDPNQPRDDAGRWTDTGTDDPDVHEAAINRWIEAAAAEMPKLDLTERDVRNTTKPRDPVYRGDTTLIGGLAVRTSIPNTDSVSATLNDGEYEELPGIRAVPLASLGLGDYRAADDRARVADLAARIKDSGEIAPLIVVRDKEGNYTLEGNHRARALQHLGYSHAPALVIIEYPRMEPRALRLVGAEFDPNQPRDKAGRWTDGPITDTTVFHGGIADHKGIVTYFTKNKEMAESYVEMSNDRFGGGGSLHKVQLTLNKPAGESDVAKAAEGLGIENEYYTPASIFDTSLHGKGPVSALVRRLKYAGYDGAVLTDIAYGKQIEDQAFIRFNEFDQAAEYRAAADPLPSGYRLSKFAAEHAAELVQAPRRVRTLIRNEVRKALRRGEGPEGIADRLDGLVAMEPGRIDTIARTEYAIARTGARLDQAASEYGDIEIVKSWVLGDESCPRCIALAGQEVPLDEDFVTEDGERVMGPPLHPNCDCDIEIREVGERERLRAAGITLVGAEFDESKHPRGPDGRWIDGSGGVFRDSKVSDADFKSFEAAVDALPKRTQQKVKHLMLTVVGSLSDYGATHSAGEVYGSRGGPYIRVKAHDPEGMKAVLYHEIGHAIAGDLANRPDVLEAFNAEREGKSGQMWYYATKPEEAVVQSFAYHLGATDSDRKTFTTKAFKNTHKAVERYIQFFKDGEIKAAPRPADMRLAPKRKSTETLAEKRARISAKFKAERRRLEGVSLIGAAEWDESKHPRVPAGDSDGGQFTEAGASANVVQLHQYTGGADKIGFEQSHAEMQRLIAAADSDATLRGAALIARWYSSATQLQGLITREVIAQALQGKTADQIEADPAFIKVRDAFNEFRNPDFLFTRKDLEDLVAAAPAYYASLRQIGPTIDTVYRGMKGTPGRSDEFELRGPTAFSHSRDIAMSYSGGTLLEIKPGAKMLPTDLLSQVSEARDNINALGKARSEAAPYMTLPAFYTRSDKRSHPLPGHGFQMGLDTDAELMSSGRFRILGREKRSVSFEDALTGKRRAKSVNVITVEQIGVF